MKNLIKAVNINTLFLTVSEITIYLFAIFALSFMGFIFKISISPIYPILALIISLISTFFIHKRIDKESTNANYFLSILLFIITFTFSYFIGGVHYVDASWDGRTYHQLATYVLKNGWNPIWDNLDTYMTTVINNVYPQMRYNIWVECYTKFGEIVAANFYSIFNKIESGKLLNLLLGFNLFYFSIFSFSKLNNIKLWQNIAISFLIVFNPVCICQTATYYVDILVYYFFMNILLLLFLKETKHINSTVFNLFMIMNITMMINVKLGGILYSFILLGGYFIYNLIIKNNTNLKTIAVIVFSVITLGLTSGINPYITNVLQDRHPFYPLAGENKIDILTHNLPKNFIGKNSLYKFTHSLFGTTEINPIKNTSLKLPLTIQKYEKRFNCPDMRINGFGYFYSGILLLTLCLIFLTRNQRDKNLKVYYLITGLIILSIISNPEAWWARYIPQFWALPLLVIVFRLNNPELKQKYKFFSYTILLLIFINSMIVEMQNYHEKYRYGKLIDLRTKNYSNIYIYEFPIKENSDVMFYVMLDEKDIKYKFVDIEYFIEHKSEFKVPPISIELPRLWKIEKKNSIKRN